ncbi:MAG: response regulator, partial [Desulfosporosinus sp.]|nr:response regulator [Desulfosporosinus sp.]
GPKRPVNTANSIQISGHSLSEHAPLKGELAISRINRFHFMYTSRLEVPAMSHRWRMNDMELRPLCLFRTDMDIAQNIPPRSRSIVDLRKGTEIAIIDDEPFAAEVNLRNHGYNIKQIGDIKNINEVSPYRIVLCDLMGVGKHFDVNKQGATLIREIKNQFPSIFVVAYTGNALNSTISRSAKEYSDKILRKDANISEWSEVLDGLINESTDPTIIWRRMKSALINRGIDVKSLLVLEDKFVRDILHKDSAGSSYMRAIQNPRLSSDLRAIAQSLVASAIFKLLVG